MTRPPRPVEQSLVEVLEPPLNHFYADEDDNVEDDDDCFKPFWENNKKATNMKGNSWASKVPETFHKYQTKIRASYQVHNKT